MDKYKCENHNLDLACLGCVKAWIARHDKLLEFVKWCRMPIKCETPLDINIHCNLVERKAWDLLKEIGEIK